MDDSGHGPHSHTTTETDDDLSGYPRHSGVKAEDVAGAHAADVRVQGQYGVNYRQYWVDEDSGKVFCLVDAPDRETATRVHREAHGLEAHTLYEVTQGA